MERAWIPMVLLAACVVGIPLQAAAQDSGPEVPASFVDGTQEPQYYVDRYESEEAYRAWFDDNYPEYDSIYHAVGLEEPDAMGGSGPAMEEPAVADPGSTVTPAGGLEFGKCGEGTELMGEICTVVEESGGGGCLIATAAYGSEMAPQVQVLREIRDNQLMQTGSGAAFMEGFNGIYYSFSPAIADMQRESPALRDATRAALAPMIHTLQIMEHADSEAGVLAYGLAVIALNAGMYVAAPAAAILVAARAARGRV